MVYEKSGGICAICGQPLSINNFNIDHWKPINQGGTNEFDNLRATHKSCNRLKNDFMAEEFFSSMTRNQACYLNDSTKNKIVCILMNEAEGRYYSAPYRKGKDMLAINSKKDAGELVDYLLYLAQGQVDYCYYTDINEIAYLLGAAKSIAQIYELREYTEISSRADCIKDDVRELTERSMTLLNRV